MSEYEKLDSKWIDEHKKRKFFDFDEYRTEVILVEDLQNLLVPKPELPVIPKFVADWIEASRHATYHLLGAVYDGAYSEDMKEWLFKGDKRTRQDNQDKLTRAWLDGFTVEEEPQYRLKAGENYLYFNLDGTVRGATKDNATITKERLEELPFDVEMAVESGIIEVEELEE